MRLRRRGEKKEKGEERERENEAKDETAISEASDRVDESSGSENRARGRQAKQRRRE